MKFRGKWTIIWNNCRGRNKVAELYWKMVDRGLSKRLIQMYNVLGVSITVWLYSTWMPHFGQFKGKIVFSENIPSWRHFTFDLMQTVTQSNLTEIISSQTWQQQAEIPREEATWGRDHERNLIVWDCKSWNCSHIQFLMELNVLEGFSGWESWNDHLYDCKSSTSIQVRLSTEARWRLKQELCFRRANLNAVHVGPSTTARSES